MNPHAEDKHARILMIDDNPGDIQLLELALRKSGLKFKLQTIEDGADALEYFKQFNPEADGPLPDLVILDLNLPKHDGFEIIEVIRNDERFDRLPVSFFSSSTSLSERSRMVAYHATSYITKPPDLHGYLSLGNRLKDMVVKLKWSGPPDF